MTRALHSVLGLAAAALVALVAASGAWLAGAALLDRAAAPAQPVAATVADVARAASVLPGLERIDRKPSGAVVATYFDGDRAAQALIDPATGAILPAPDASPLATTIRNLHRKLLLGDAGRLAVGLGALALLALTISGLPLLARRLGGWRRLAGPIRGAPAQRWHSELARAALLGLTLSAATGVALSATTFGLLPEAVRAAPEAAVSTPGTRLPPGDVAALRAVALTDLRGLQFPAADDPSDVYTLTTASGEAIVDAVSGAVLVRAENGAWRRLYETIHALHAGEFAWPATALVGLSSAAAPVLIATGLAVWAARRRARPRRVGAVAAQAADCIVLVGSEGGTTWGAAAALGAALTGKGLKVHVCDMNALAPSYRAARRLIVLTATYGSGDAPASAARFLSRLADWRGGPLDAAVLGFGDRRFPSFCGYAERVEAALAAQGFRLMTAPGRVDRQSAQDVAAWGRALGAAMGLDLDLAYAPDRPETVALTLRERIDYGAEVGAPTVVLRFAATGGAGLPRFQPGDLLGVVAPGAEAARFYSLASARRDGVAEICVRLRPGGLCSSFLHALAPGATVQAFVRANPGFHPAPGRAPVVLIGAGAGVAPLAGFVRSNAGRRPIWLYCGARHPASDFLYEGDLRAALADGRLAALRPAFSRTGARAYVQTALAGDAEALRGLVGKGAQILVCGGRDMARGVGEALAGVLAPLGLTVADLKREGRYVEDVY